MEELTGREVLIMKCVWNAKGEIAFSQLKENLKRDFDWDAKRTTIRTFITDMEKKGFLQTERKGKYSYATALVDEELYRKEQAEKMIDFWYDGSKGTMIRTLLDEDETKEDVEELRKFLNELLQRK